MELTTQYLSRFIGGEIEIKTKTQYLRGPVKEIEGTEHHLHIVYEWLATAPADSLTRQRWMLSDQYVVDLDYTAINLTDLGDRILLVCSSEDAQYIVFSSSLTPELSKETLTGKP